MHLIFSVIIVIILVTLLEIAGCREVWKFGREKNKQTMQMQSQCLMLGKTMSGSKHHCISDMIATCGAGLIGTGCYWADESVSWDLTTISWEVHRICGFNISSSSGSSSDILVDTLAELRSLYGWWWWLFTIEDPDDDVALDAGGAHDDATFCDDGVFLVHLMHMMMTAMMYDRWWILMMMYDDD